MEQNKMQVFFGSPTRAYIPKILPSDSLILRKHKGSQQNQVRKKAKVRQKRKNRCKEKEKRTGKVSSERIQTI